MSEAACRRCGRKLPGPDTGLCADCQAALPLEVMPSSKSQPIQLGPILSEALAQVQPGEDLDEALLRALKSQRPEEAATLLPAVSRLISEEAQRQGGSREDAARRLAETGSSGEITVRTSGGRFPTFTTVVEKRVITLGDKKYGPLEELPPEARRAVEAELRRVERPKVRVGCSTALLSVMLSALMGRG
ncbi:MAG: hypothetical protein ACE149_13500 [Armatimonadota bacterium]